MPGIILCGNEGEWATFENTLSEFGADDKRRGAVLLTTGQQMFREWNGVADTWIHFRVAMLDSSSSTGIPQVFAKVRDDTTSEICGLTDNSTHSIGYGDVQFVRKETSAGLLIANPELFPYVDSDWYTYDIHIVVTGSDITYSFYRNEILRYTQTFTDSGFLNPAQLLITFRNTNTAQDDVWVQDVIVTDAIPTVGMELATLVPSAVGEYSAFGNDYTNINDFGYDSGTSITAVSTGLRESWVFSDPDFDLGDKVIYALALSTVAQTDLGGVVDDFVPFLRISATNYDGTTLGANNTAPGNYTTIFTTNPDTTNPWLQADLVGLEAGLRSV